MEEEEDEGKERLKLCIAKNASARVCASSSRLKIQNSTGLFHLVGSIESNL